MSKLTIKSRSITEANDYANLHENTGSFNPPTVNIKFEAQKSLVSG